MQTDTYRTNALAIVILVGLLSAVALQAGGCNGADGEEGPPAECDTEAKNPDCPPEKPYCYLGQCQACEPGADHCPPGLGCHEANMQYKDSPRYVVDNYYCGECNVFHPDCPGNQSCVGVTCSEETDDCNGVSHCKCVPPDCQPDAGMADGDTDAG